MKKVLIVKRNNTDFDNFVINRIASECPEADVMDLFWAKGRIGRKLVNILKTHFDGKLLGIICRVSSKKIKSYRTIILFDDYPDLPLVKFLKKKNSNCKYKIWFWNVPNYSIENYREEAELYCFDYKFCERNKLTYINQFYLTDNESKYMHDKTTEYNDVVYIGYDKNRYKILKSLAELFEEQKIKARIILITETNSNKYQNSSCFDITNKFLKYEDIINIENNSKAIIEIVNDNQTGLTLRTLEALCLGKKLITNNVEIKKSEIYCKENVFVINEDSYDELSIFLNTPYKSINVNLANYSINNWYDKIMNL